MATIKDIKDYVDPSQVRKARSCEFDEDVMIEINTLRVSKENAETKFTKNDLINAAMRKALYLPIKRKK